MKNSSRNSVSVVCPVSAKRVDENVARIAAVYTILLVSFAVVTKQPYLLLVLATDFALRAFTDGRYSLFRFLSRRTARLLHLNPVPVDAAPKKFAAAVGLLFSLLILVGVILGFRPLWLAASSVLVVCAFLEAAFAYCLGCVVYSLLVHLFSSPKD